MLKKITALLLLIFVSANMLFSATYYVSTTGNDAGNGSSGSPWLTVGKSIAKLVAGDTLIVTAGTYKDSNGGGNYSFKNSGTATSPITIIGQNAVIDIQSQTGSVVPIYAWTSGGSYLIIDGLKFTTSVSGGLNGSGAVYLGTGSSHSSLQNLELYNIGGHAPSSGDDCILFQNMGAFNTFSNIFVHDIKDCDIFRIWGHDILITSCTISNFTNPNYGNSSIHADCFQTFYDNNPSGFSYNIVIEKTLFMNIPSSQLGNLSRDSAAGPFGWTFRNNVFKNCAKNLNAGIPNLYFFNNTFDGCGSLNKATIIYTTSGPWDSTGALFINNALINSAGVTGPVTSRNNSSSASGFVNPLANDYNLTAGSPLIGAGTNLSGYFTSDANGNPRPSSGAWDIGAYQFRVVSSANPLISVSVPALDFGSVSVGGSVTNSITVRNIGGGTLTGNTPNVVAPFSIVSGETYNLTSNQTQTVKISFNPMLVGNANQLISFTGGGGASLALSGVGISTNPSVSVISVNASDVDPNTTGLQIYAGSVVAFSASASNALAYQWNYTVNGGPPIILQSGSGAVSTASFTFGSSAVNNTYVWTLTVSNGQASASSQLALSVVSPPAVIPGLTFSATAGAITSPFAVSSSVINGVTYNYIAQPVTTSVTSGGSASYNFTITEAGEYAIQALVNAPNDGANSLFVNIDGEPQDPAMIWDITPTSGFEQQNISWRGTGTDIANQFVPKFFNLSAGLHQITFRGREANTQLSSFSLLKRLSQPPFNPIFTPK